MAGAVSARSGFPDDASYVSTAAVGFAVPLNHKHRKCGKR